MRTLFKDRLLREHPEIFAKVPAKVWKRHWNVDSRPAGSGLNALRYLSRYVFKTATSNRQVQRLSNGQLRWPYRDSQTGHQTSIDLEPLDWMGRLLQHILPPGFARVRTFGWLHPAAKVRANRVRALLGQKPLLSPAEQQAWDLPGDSDLDPPQTPQSKVCSTPLCPRCRQPMRLSDSFGPSPRLLLPFPNRPP